MQQDLFKNRPGTHRRKSFVRRLRFHTGWAVVVILALSLIGESARNIALHAADREKAQVRRHAAEICAAFGKPTLGIGEPELIASSTHSFFGGHMRRLWLVHCAEGREEYDLLFDMRTGALCSIYADFRAAEKQRASSAVMTIDSPGMARDVAMSYMARFRLTPSGARAALAEPPEREERGTAWRVVWRVRSPGVAGRYDVRFLLSRDGGKPLVVVDTNALEHGALL